MVSSSLLPAETCRPHVTSWPCIMQDTGIASLDSNPQQPAIEGLVVMLHVALPLFLYLITQTQKDYPVSISTWLSSCRDLSQPEGLRVW